MFYKSLLNAPKEHVLPWLGGRTVTAFTGETWTITGDLPPEFGFWTFMCGNGRTASWVRFLPISDPLWALSETDRATAFYKTGYLFGNLLITPSVIQNVNLGLTPREILQHVHQPIFLTPRDLPRFALVSAIHHPRGMLIYSNEEFSLDPVEAVNNAFIEGLTSVSHIPNVPPTLEVAFRLNVLERQEEEEQRARMERARQEAERIEAEKKAREEMRERAYRATGDGQLRRTLAATDYPAAAQAALRVSGADLIDVRPSSRPGEMNVYYRCEGQRLGCVCDMQLRVINAGICLTDHDTREQGDQLLTLESLPSVVREAVRDRKLVIYIRG